MIYKVRAKPWRNGWELHIDDIGVTQSRTLEAASQQILDYVGCFTGKRVPVELLAAEAMIGGGEVQLSIYPDLGSVTDLVKAALAAATEAARQQDEAERQARAAARALRDEGVSVADAAYLLCVSKARVSRWSRDP
ncbi:antitoxin HicB [Calidifontibacter sp. DB0510]|uniref:Antitoxin HicB n=1 Tax=Metallococcus carri TaxID=1656884 RepID=A0A967EFE3_9MICO|nr:antitoxin HicB [Metallococcus carri]NHN56551.1 antitoxin HicB [Metallococcus carri]NOP38850.1 antitoxin HicB [Calidifontibacter sp. DB2511S]